MAKYRKKPVEVDAIKLNTNNLDDVFELLDPVFPLAYAYSIGQDLADPVIRVQTTEGPKMLFVGDYVIKTVQDEIFIRTSEIFEQTYDKVI